jgi:hypothetical protein
MDACALSVGLLQQVQLRLFLLHCCLQRFVFFPQGLRLQIEVIRIVFCLCLQPIVVSTPRD